MVSKSPVYNNNILSFNGKLSRLAYILQNLFLNLIGFRFLYYPAIIETLHTSSDYKLFIETLANNSAYAPMVKYLVVAPETAFYVIVIKYLFIIPFRMIDIKRLRDIVSRELTQGETIFYAVVFSLPYVDFVSTFTLSLLRPGKYASNQLAKEIQAADLNEAQKEKLQEQNRKLFEAGKISRADYLKKNNDKT